MNDLLSQLFLLVSLSAICFYLIISIFKKELPTEGITLCDNHNYKGKRAIFLSIFFLVILTLPALISFSEKENIFVLLSLLIGLIIAIISHKYFVEHPGTIVPDKIKPRKIETSNLILWGIVGIFAGFIIAMLTFSFVSFIFSYNFAIIMSILLFLTTVVFIAKHGAKYFVD